MMRNLVIILSLLCASCQQSVAPFDQFGRIEELTEYELIYSDKDAPMGFVREMAVYNNLLILQHSQDEYDFSLINVETNELLRRWGSRGQGPNEYIQVGSPFMIYNSQLVFLNQGGHREVIYASISDILEKGDGVHLTREQLPSNAGFRPSMSAHVIDGKKVVLGYYKEGRFGFIDSTNHILPCPYDYPYNYEPLEGIYRGAIFQSRMASNSAKKSFVLSTLNSDVFEIYQLVDTGVQRVYVSEFQHVPPVVKSRGQYTLDWNNSIVGITQLSATDNLIAMNYSSENDSDISELDRTFNEVFCFDWTGKKKIKYLLPFPVQRFCMSEQFMYGIKYNGEDMEIYQFKL